MNFLRHFPAKGFSKKSVLLQVSLSVLFFSIFLSGCPNFQTQARSVVAVTLPTGGGGSRNLKNLDDRNPRETNSSNQDIKARKAFNNSENHKTDDISLWTVNLVRPEKNELYQTQTEKSGKTVEFEIEDEIPLKIEIFGISENGELYAAGKSQEFRALLGQTTEVPVSIKWNYLSVKSDSRDVISVSAGESRDFSFSVRAECDEDETSQFTFEWFSSNEETDEKGKLPSDAKFIGGGKSEYIKAEKITDSDSYDYYKNVFSSSLDLASGTQVYYCLASRKFPYLNAPESKKILGPFVVTSAELKSITAEFKANPGSDYDILCGENISLSDFKITEKFSDGKERGIQNPDEDSFSLDFSSVEITENQTRIYKIGNVPATVSSISNPGISSETRIRVAYDFSGKSASLGGTKPETKLAEKIYAFDGLHSKIGEEIKIKADDEMFFFYPADSGDDSDLYSEINFDTDYIWSSSKEGVVRDSKITEISLSMSDLNLSKDTNLTQTAKISLSPDQSQSAQESPGETQNDAKKYLKNLPESIETVYPVSVCLWNISVEDTSGSKTTNLENLSAEETYTVLAENAAYTAEKFQEIQKLISVSSSSGSGFSASGMTFTAPSAKASEQSTTILVKFTNDASGTEGMVLGRLNVKIPADTKTSLAKIAVEYKGSGYVLGSQTGTSGATLTELPETLPSSDFTVTEHYTNVEGNETTKVLSETESPEELKKYTFRWNTNVDRSLSIGQVPVSVSKAGESISVEDVPVTVKYNIDVYGIATDDKNFTAEQKTDGTTFPLGEEITAKTWKVWTDSQSQEKSDSFAYQWKNIDDAEISGETKATYNAPLSSSGMICYTRTHNLISPVSEYYVDSVSGNKKNEIIYWLDITAAPLNETAADWDNLKNAVEKIGSASGTIKLTGTDYTATTTRSGEGTITVSGNVTIVSGAGATISRGNGNYYFTAPFFTIASGATLKLQADSTNTLTLDGGYSSRPTSNQTLSLIDCKGNLEIGEHITLKNNQNDSGDGYGGAIYVHKDTSSSSSLPSLKFNGTIESCTANDGGAIYVSDNTNQISVIMNGATISNNTANGTRSGAGGGIYLNNANALFTSVTFTGNKADSDSSNSLGGAIFGKGTNLNLTITNCTFTGNYSSKGAKPDSLYFEAGTVTKDGEDISNSGGVVLNYEE